MNRPVLDSHSSQRLGHLHLLELRFSPLEQRLASLALLIGDADSPLSHEQSSMVQKYLSPS